MVGFSRTSGGSNVPQWIRNNVEISEYNKFDDIM